MKIVAIKIRKRSNESASQSEKRIFFILLSRLPIFLVLQFLLVGKQYTAPRLYKNCFKNGKKMKCEQGKTLWSGGGVKRSRRMRSQLWKCILQKVSYIYSAASQIPYFCYNFDLLAFTSLRDKENELKWYESIVSILKLHLLVLLLRRCGIKYLCLWDCRPME